ncbi:unnamed protein product [Closterium sp. Naga37s-1]|nr:unnamed protein product [Closterium sp. Naga37s-1]
MHFMNPPVIMSLVEVVPGLATSDHTLHLTKGLAHRWGDIGWGDRAFYALLEGVGTPMDIDRGMKLGLDTCVAIMQVLHAGLGDAKYRPCPLLFPQSPISAPHCAIHSPHLSPMFQPMGPLHLADLIGLDTCVAIMRVLHAGLGDAKYRPCPLLVQYVDAGWLGRKSGRGVYEYPRQEEVGGDAKYRPCPLLVQYADAGWLGRKSGRGVYEYPTQEEGGREGEVEGEGGEKEVRGRQLAGRQAGH